ncbi:hypothetical protein DCS_04134 [Drechmeria coniospora]|uniref:Secreted protein n=1 Tax=Drechmeria coniospora TaxID=98403 RepID=A0A151GJ50_DRECN|nr:hypothetical protein DCS_04134 [Drechmeria coniospora]KYK57127.1 hypothetical protein DCS_04134 [Drechmeria coniospora]
MRFDPIFTPFFLFLGTLGSVAPRGGYKVALPSWTVEIVPGRTVVLNGTIQQVQAQLNRMNLSRTAHVPETDNSTLHSRHASEGTFSFPGYIQSFCNVFPKADPKNLFSSIRMLRDDDANKKEPTLGPGPNLCSKISCQNWAAVWWCNDNSTPMTLSSANSVADGADYIMAECGGSKSDYSGQVFHPTGWNVVLRYSNCEDPK